jgi:hypothetical protein
MFNRSNPKSRFVTNLSSRMPTAPQAKPSAGWSDAVWFWTKERMSRLALRPPTRYPLPSTQVILVGRANATTHAFLPIVTRILPGLLHLPVTPSRALRTPRVEMKYNRTFKMLKRVRSEVRLPTQKRRNIELVVLRLRMHRNARTHLDRWRARLRKLRSCI